MSPEFSRPYRLGAAEPRSVELRANAAECAALAARFGIPGIERIEARLTLTSGNGNVTALRGTLEADVVQSCVVTLEPVAQHVAAALDLRLLPAGMPATDDDPDSPDEIETQSDRVDLGEVVAEQLALALDPYPRAPDAVIPPDLDGAALEPKGDPDGAAPDPSARTPAGDPDGRPNPFAALARLKRN